MKAELLVEATRRYLLVFAVVAVGILGTAVPSTAQPTGSERMSGSSGSSAGGAPAQPAAIPLPGAITFSEYPVGTAISGQYTARGVVFGGDSPFITDDGANPTSPVLSGSPRFFGDITISIVDPGSGAASTTTGLTLDVGYIDNRNSVLLTYYGLAGNLIGSLRANAFGINRVAVPFGGISRVTIAATQTEDAGFAIDNVTLGTAGPRATLLSMASLGDSFTSGEGTYRYYCGTDLHGGTYYENTNAPTGWWDRLFAGKECDTTGAPLGDYKSRPKRYYENLCHVSPDAWPRRVAATAGVPSAFFACSGAVTANLGFTDEEKVQYPASPAGVPGRSLQGLDLATTFPGNGPAPSLITVGIGGNDAGFSGIITTCLGLPCLLKPGFKGSAIGRINNEVYPKLVSTFREIRRSYPTSAILTYGYPSVVDGSTATCAGVGFKAFTLDSAEREWANTVLLPELNQAVEDAAAAAGITFMPIDQVTSGHEVCTSDPWINGLSWGDDKVGVLGNESFHPNAKAHAAIASNFFAHYTTAPQYAKRSAEAATVSLLFENPEPAPNIRPPAQAVSLVVGEVQVGSTTACGPSCTVPVCTKTACELEVRLSNFSPETRLALKLTGSVDLGEVTTDEAGAATARFALPASVPDGHTLLEVTGTSPGGLEQVGTGLVNVVRLDEVPVQPPVTSPTIKFVRAAHRDFLGREPSAAELATAVAAIDSGRQSRSEFVATLSSSEEWVGAVVRKMYKDTLGREGEPAGVAFWSKRIRTNRLTVAAVAANLYASSEYFNGIGEGSSETWIRDLYAKLLNRTPDAAGAKYWAERTRTHGRVAVAYGFFQSNESAHQRVKVLYQQLLGREPEAAGWDYWANRVKREGDLALAANLAASPEYLQRAQTRF